MDWDEIVVFLLSVGLAVYAISIGAWKESKRGTLKQYLVGMGVGVGFGIGAVFTMGWSWVIALALGIGSVAIAPTVAEAWKRIVKARRG